MDYSHMESGPLVWWKSFFATPYRRSCKGLALTKHFISEQPHFGHNCFWGWGCTNRAWRWRNVNCGRFMDRRARIPWWWRRLITVRVLMWPPNAKLPRSTPWQTTSGLTIPSLYDWCSVFVKRWMLLTVHVQVDLAKRPAHIQTSAATAVQYSWCTSW
jgi:hypothetical protein